MISIKPKPGTLTIRDRFRRLERKQMPFAASLAINKTLEHIVEAEEKESKSKIDRPKPQSVKAYYKRNSTKRRLRGLVLLKTRNQYMAGLIKGGKEGYAQPVPGKDVRLNQYGNLGRKATKGKGVFYKDINGLKGHWKRMGGKRNPYLRLIAHWPKVREYKKQLDFYGVADRTVKRWFRVELRKATEYARRTAR
jgi:hypothetical protein